MGRYRPTVILALIAIIVLGGCQLQPISEPIAEPTQAQPPEPVSILFVGNSMTYYNGGVENYFKMLGSLADPPVEMEVESSTASDATLKNHWEWYGVPDKIRDGNYDIVVLQPRHLMSEEQLESFFEYANKFYELTQELDIDLAFYLTWYDDRVDMVREEELNLSNSDDRDGSGFQIAPVGLAWQEAQAQHPEIAIYAVDKLHPSLHGTYLAAAVIYATLFDMSPVGIPYWPAYSSVQISEDEAAILQQIGWDTVQQFAAQ